MDRENDRRFSSLGHPAACPWPLHRHVGDGPIVDRVSGALHFVRRGSEHTIPKVETPAPGETRDYKQNRCGPGEDLHEVSRVSPCPEEAKGRSFLVDQQGGRSHLSILPRIRTSIQAQVPRTAARTGSERTFSAAQQPRLTTPRNSSRVGLFCEDFLGPPVRAEVEGVAIAHPFENAFANTTAPTTQAV